MGEENELGKRSTARKVSSRACREPSPTRRRCSLRQISVVLLGDALIGHPPGQLRFVPEHKLDNPAQFEESLRKLLTLEFKILLLCDGHSVLEGARRKVEEFLRVLS